MTKKLGFLLSLFLCISAVSFAAVTPVSNGCSTSSSTNLSTISCTVSSVTIGETMFINLTQYASGQTPTITDSNTASISNILGGTTGTYYAGEYNWVWVITMPTAGTHTISIQATTEFTAPSIMAVVLTGANSLGPVDGKPTATVASIIGPTNPCGTVTTTVPDEFLLTFANISKVAIAGGVLTVGTNPQAMTLIQSADQYNMAAYGIATLPKPNYVRWDYNSPSTWVCNTIAVH